MADKKKLSEINTEDPPARSRKEIEELMSPEALERDRERDRRIKAAMEKARDKDQ